MIQLNSTEEGLELWVRYEEISIMARKTNPVSTILLPDMVPEFTLVIMNNGVRHHVKETPKEVVDMGEDSSEFLKAFGIGMDSKEQLTEDNKEGKTN